MDIKTIISNIKLILSVLLLIIASFSVYKLIKLTDKIEILESNQEVFLTNHNNDQITLTAKEFKKMLPELDSLVKTLKIKTKNITNVIDTKYSIKDTLIKNYSITKDSVSHTSRVYMNDGCFDFVGEIEKDTFRILTQSFNDRLVTFLYKDYKHKYIWGLIKTEPYFTSKVWSQCKNDTISVTRNIKIK